MDEYELPKLIPMTGGRDETSAGSRSATPFGGAFDAIVVALVMLRRFFFVAARARSPGPDRETTPARDVTSFSIMEKH